MSHFEKQIRTQRTLGSRRRFLNLCVESLETRTLLSTVSAALNTASDPSHIGVVFGTKVAVVGQADPGSLVRLARNSGCQASPVRADAQGDYRLNVRLKLGVDVLQITAADRTGSRAATILNLTCSNSVVTWNAATLQAIRVAKTPPPIAARDLAIIQIAISDSVTAILQNGTPIHVSIKAPIGASVDAAVASAAHSALVALFPSQAVTFDSELSASLNSVSGKRATKLGSELGDAVAAQILAWRATDGASTAVVLTPSTDVGKWRPTPSAYAPALLPRWGNVTPFVLTSGSQITTNGPPALTSPEYAAALNQVQSLGSKNSSTRTADQTQIALFWSDNAGTVTPPGHWNEIAERLSVDSHDSISKDARLFAALDMAEADAGIAVWNAKYTDMLWRPITAIQLAGTDDNPATTADPNWTPLLATPPFPSYVSGHSAFSAAACEVLASVFGATTNFSTGSDTLPGVRRYFSSFAAAAAEAGMSRIYGGIHYSFDNIDGLALGKTIGDLTTSKITIPVR